VCLSGLFPDLHLPTHFIAVTTSRTTSTLHDLSPPLLSRVVVTQTGVVELRRSLAGGAGVSSPPIVIKVSIRPCLSPLVPSRQLLQSSVGSSSLSLSPTLILYQNRSSLSSFFKSISASVYPQQHLPLSSTDRLSQ